MPCIWRNSFNFLCSIGLWRYLSCSSRTRDSSFPFYGYVWKDRNKIITILGIHLILLGIGAFLLVFRALYLGGVYDTWALGGRYKKNYQVLFLIIY